MSGSLPVFEGEPWPEGAAELDATRLLAALQAQARELREAQRRAEAADRTKSRFLATVSHEIRTPLNGILGMTALALETTLTNEQRDYLEMVQASGRSLLRVINDILDFSRIEAGKLDLDPVAFDLRSHLAELLSPLRTQARDKGLALEWHIAPDVPQWIISDPVRLDQILSNLLGNALKFTQQGEIAVEVRRLPSDAAGSSGCTTVSSRADQPCLLQFTVRDTGIGVAPDMQQLIFAPFTQADGSTTRRFGGTGLGLSICARLVEMMHGNIWVESTSGAGAAFHFTVQCQPVTVQCQPAVAAASSAGPSSEAEHHAAPLASRPLSILLAEHDQVNQRLATRALEKDGHAVHLAANAQSALDLVADRVFDVILMDVHLPEVDGVAAARAIRESNRSARRAPIIAMTAHATEGERERCLEAGMDDYLAKPVQAADLRRIVARVRAQSQRESARDHGPAAGFDPEVLLSRTAGDLDLARDLAALFRAEAPRHRQQLREALAQGDLAGLFKTAHALKGSISTFGASAAYELAARLESQSREGSEHVATTVEEMEGELTRLERRLEGFLAQWPREGENRCAS